MLKSINLINIIFLIIKIFFTFIFKKILFSFVKNNIFNHQLSNIMCNKIKYVKLYYNNINLNNVQNFQRLFISINYIDNNIINEIYIIM